MSKTRTNTTSTGTSTSTSASTEGTRRPRTIRGSNLDRAGTWQEIEGVLDSPVYWSFAADIPEQAREGRRRKLPTIFYVIMPALAAVWESFDNAAIELRDDDQWHRLCRLVCKYQKKYRRPGERRFAPNRLYATSPLTAQNFHDARATWLAPHWGKLRGIFQQAAAEAATQLGYCDPSGPGGINNLRRERMLAGDGKVTREPRATYRALAAEEQAQDARYGEMSHVVELQTGKIVPTREMTGSAHLYKDGAGRIVVGHKTVRIAVRDNEHRNSTIILDVAADDEKNEAKLATSMLCDAADRLPGALGVVYDTALKGTHIATLAAHGLVTICPISASSNAGKSKNSSKRVEKEGSLGSKTHTLDDGEDCVHRFVHHGGHVCEIVTDSDGNTTLESLGDPHLELRRAKQHHNLYAHFAVTCDRHQALDGKTYRFDMRWNIAKTPEQGCKGKAVLNVAENIRAIPPGGDIYHDTYGWRETVENDNHQSEKRKYQRRGRSKKAEHNLINEIGVAMVVNGNALRLSQARRARAHPPGPAPAAA